MEAQIEKTILGKNLFTRGEEILVAVSGGLDSMALLHLLWRLHRAQQWKLVVAHFNHQLRKESSGDEPFVKGHAERLGLEFESGSGEVRCAARELGCSLEMAGRKLRHEFLAERARQRGISTISLGHHADDQVELFFLRLLRGAGGEGLGGMKWTGLSPADGAIQLVRPLLEVTREELERYVRVEKIPFREDATNALPEFERNQVRHELLPWMRERFQPALTGTVLRTMGIIGAEAEFVRKTAREFRGLERTKSFDRLHRAVQRQVILLELVERGLRPEYDWIEMLREYPGRHVTLGAGRVLWRDAEGKIHEAKAPAPFDPEELTVHLAGGEGEIEFGGKRIRWEKIWGAGDGIEPLSAGVNLEFFDAGKVGAKVRLRHWRSGDRYQPIGMGNEVKLQDLFTNEKIPRGERRKLVAGVTEQGEIFWVERLRMAERFKLDKQTVCRLKWEWTAN
jgi:tRNA(Ile)-lysidine synthase